MSSHLIDVIVPAAGVGKRMMLNIPKQYAKIQNKTILEHTLDALLACKAVNKIIVGISKTDEYFDELAINNDRIIKGCGGKERADTVRNCLSLVSTPWVMVHDAARPLVELHDLNNLASMTNEDIDGAILAAACADTLKFVEDGTIKHTVDRKKIYRAFTPQLMKTKLLQDALNQCYDRGLEITDEASAMEQLGHKIKIVEGSSLNFKITRPEDLFLAKLIFKSRIENV